MLVDKQNELMSDLLFTVHQHGGDDVTWKPPSCSNWTSPRRVSPFSRGVIFTRARVSLALLSQRENNGLKFPTLGNSFRMRQLHHSQGTTNGQTPGVSPREDVKPSLIGALLRRTAKNTGKPHALAVLFYRLSKLFPRGAIITSKSLHISHITHALPPLIYQRR